MADKIRILKRQAIAYDGINVRGYEVGEEHEIGTELMPPAIADVLLEDGRAELVRPKSASGNSVAQENKPHDPEKEKVAPPRKGVGPSEIKGN